MPNPLLRSMAALAALCVAFPGVASEIRTESSPAAESMIRHFSDGLIDIMKRSDDLGLEGRAATIAPVVRQCFDLTSMARATVGRAWNDLSEDERGRWVEAFTDNTIYRLAARFNAYSGQSFEIVGQKPASRGTIIVQTNLHRPAEDDVRLDYRVREEESGWKVIDIYARGTISEVAVRRSEYAKVLQEDGIDVLIESVSALTERKLARE